MSARSLVLCALAAPLLAGPTATGQPAVAPLWSAETPIGFRSEMLCFTPDSTRVAVERRAGSHLPTLDVRDVATSACNAFAPCLAGAPYRASVAGARSITAGGDGAFEYVGGALVGRNIRREGPGFQPVRFPGVGWYPHGATVALGAGDKVAYCIDRGGGAPGHFETTHYSVTLQDLMVDPGPKPPVSLIRGEHPALAAAVSTEASLFIAAVDPPGEWGKSPRLECWSLHDKPSKTTIPLTPNRHPTAAAVSPDGRFVAAGREDGVVSCYTLADGRLVSHSTPPPRQDYIVAAVAFHPAGDYLAYATHGSRGSYTVCLVEIETGKVLYGFDADRRGVSALAFSPDGKRLATFGGSGHLKMWDAEALLKLAK